MSEAFHFTMNPLELMLRGTIIYIGLILVFRYLLRRDVGSLAMPDILFIVLVADASQNAMAGEYKSIVDGAVLLGTLVFWNIAFDWLGYRVRGFRRFIIPPAVPLIKDGKWIRRNLKAEWITTDEVQAKLREQSIDDISTVKLATLEPDGELSVLKNEGGEAGHHKRRTFPG